MPSFSSSDSLFDSLSFSVGELHHFLEDIFLVSPFFFSVAPIFPFLFLLVGLLVAVRGCFGV